MGKLFLVLLLTVMFLSASVNAQVVINEYLSSNLTGLIDEDNDFSDWVELYNNSDQPVNLQGYKIGDSRNYTKGWLFPDITLPARSFLLVFASGKDKDGISTKLHTVIKQGDSWRYVVTSGNMPGGWRETTYNDSSWKTGKSGFGYGDNDDATVLTDVSTLLIRTKFEIADVGSISSLQLHVDYDDGFIAFINGTMVAMGSIESHNDDYTSVQASNHEAALYKGGKPEGFDISSSISLLKNGTNVIAIQGHNSGSGSSDFSLIPFLTIGSSEYSSNDVASFISVEEGCLHTHFKISKEGETLYLFNAAAALIDSSEAVALENDISYGRYQNGSSQWFYFAQPTPGSSNINPLDSITSDSVLFSHTAGFYSQPFELTMQSTSAVPGEIRYTTNGWVPTVNDSLYSSPISVSSTTVFRAAHFSAFDSTNPVTTGTFIFDVSNGLPVVSISSDSVNLFGWETGIFEFGPNAGTENPYQGANFWMDWERPIHFEYFDQQQQLQVNQDAGIKVAGNWSRAKAQKSVALYARKEYGKGNFDFKFFHDRENGSFESILLRNSGNDWASTFYRDGMVSEIARGMNMERLAYQPAKIFLNGAYWGILNLREKPSEHYFSENFGIDEDNLSLLELNGTIVHGSNTDYTTLKNFMSSKSINLDENYRQVSEMMDISCFIDYQILEIFIDNEDWPGNNIKYWKTDDPISKWRWLLFDTDFGLGLYGSNTNTMEFATTATQTDWPNPSWSTLFLRKLLTNNEFKMQFINRFSDCMNTNLKSDKLLVLSDSIQNMLIPEIENHLGRWGFSYTGWLNQVRLLETFVINRRNIMRGHLRTFFGFNQDKLITLDVSDRLAGKIKINTIIPPSYPFQGYYFSEVPVTLSAIPNPGFRFVGWQNGSTSADRTITFHLTEHAKYSAVFEPATEIEQAVVINEINYKSSDEFDAGDWIELYNNGTQTVDLSGWLLRDTDQDTGFEFPQGMLLYPGDYIVVAENLSKFGSLFSSVKNVTGDFIYGLNSSSDIVYLFNAEGLLIDMVNYNAASPWPANPNGLGPTLELEHPSYNNELASSWTAGPDGGTPGIRNSVYVGTEVITTVNYKAICFPTLFSDYTTLQFFNKKEGSYTVQIIDLQGRMMEQINGSINSGGTTSIDLFTNTGQYKAGVYLVRVYTHETIQTVKVVKR